MNRNYEERKRSCLEYFYYLCDELRETHTIVGSCNNDCSLYLVPKGTESQITYYSKPVDSYRFSDHWNWYANLKKCPDEKYVQCFNPDLPWARRRSEDGRATRPIFGVCVAYFDADQKYHTVFGERFNRRTKKWRFG